MMAQEVGVSERTLRRAVARDLLHATPLDERTSAISPLERAYVRSHWNLVSRLLEALRKQPNVRLAVLYGSVARGEEREDSDLDLLVRLRRDDYGVRAELMDTLSQAADRQVQIVSLEQAEEAPLLLSDVLLDGRVLVDREGDWSRLRSRKRQILQRAREKDELLERLAWEMLEHPELVIGKGVRDGTR